MYFYCRGYNTHVLWVSMTCYKRTRYTAMLLLDFTLDVAIRLCCVTFEGDAVHFPVMISERQSGQLDEWLVLNHCERMSASVHHQAQRGSANLVKACGMEAVLASLAWLTW